MAAAAAHHHGMWRARILSCARAAAARTQGARGAVRGVKAMKLNVGDLMTRSLVCLTLEHTVGQARFKMKLGGMRHLPIVDGDKKLLGIVSDRDLLGAVDRTEDTPIGEVMTTELQTVFEDTPAREAAALMVQLKIGSLPVVDHQKRLLGVVTETDFLVVAHQALSDVPIDRSSEAPAADDD
jgi:CBS domain-containing protein